jgi:hypothetical protein
MSEANRSAESKDPYFTNSACRACQLSPKKSVAFAVPALHKQ